MLSPPCSSPNFFRMGCKLYFRISRCEICDPSFSQNAKPLRRAPTDLPFRLIDGWAVVVKGTIGGEPSRTILIDTGAVPSAISKEMAKKLGLPGSAEQVSVMNRAIGVERVRVSNVQVEPVAANSFDMVAADFGTIEQALHTRLDAVIGLDLLGGQNFTIDYRGKKILFGIGVRAVQAVDSVTFQLRHAAGGTYVLVPMESGGENSRCSSTLEPKTSRCSGPTQRQPAANSPTQRGCDD